MQLLCNGWMDGDAKIGYYAAWIGGIICRFVFPPIGIFLTGFAIIMSIHEGRNCGKKYTTQRTRSKLSAMA